MTDTTAILPGEHRLKPVFRPSPETIILGILALFVATISLAPLGRLALTAIAPEGVLDLTSAWNTLAKPRVFTAAINSLYVALASTLLAVIIGSLAALITVHCNMRYKAAWVFGFVLPLMIPPQVTALAWVQAFSPTSPVLGFFGLALTPGMRHPLFSAWGIIFLLGIYNAPLVFLTVRAALRRLPANLSEAARASGAGNIQLIFTILFPLARSGIFAGAAIAFVSAIGNFGIQAMLGIPARFPTLITLIYQQLNSYGPSALSDMASLSLLLSLITVIALGLSTWLGGRGDLRVEEGGRPAQINLGRWKKLVEAGAWLYLAATLLLPMSALVATSLVKGFGQKLTLDTLTPENYTNALFHHVSIRDAFATSFMLTVATVILLSVISLVLAYFISWKKSTLVRLIQMASELSYVLPGIILGVAMILFFLLPLPLLGFSIYGTIWIILAAYLSNFLALALRPMLGGFSQIDRSLDEAARVAGADFFQRIRDIILPLLAPAVIAGGIIVFMSALNEIQVSILLVSSSARTIGPMIVFLEEGGSSTLAAAVGCLMILIVLALMGIASLFANRLPKGALPWHD
ncbi:ABC transporter permease [Brucella thiophenivorans]|uniref:Binding-protein-dependent transport system inner membrane component family protein n=1 Tax=Brucella thiophenivorans TaxID=571255 RepID=A0A256FJV4_9HYPH|nr:iron ABC transporter permease [Brucella thiophenivorans]OYR15134.1 binding-protein-dependent transport system inner membrane component family protein [Brucella thiophenivorans]